MESASKRKFHHTDLEIWFYVGYFDVTAAAKVSVQETGLSLGNLAGFLYSLPFSHSLAALKT